MNKLFQRLKSFFVKTDTLRERLEDKLADVLEKLDGSESLDTAEKKAIISAINTAGSYYGITIPEDVSSAISEELVKCFGKINQKLQTQLRK